MTVKASAVEATMVRDKAVEATGDKATAVKVTMV